jgi:hypothetical protein
MCCRARWGEARWGGSWMGRTGGGPPARCLGASGGCASLLARVHLKHPPTPPTTCPTTSHLPNQLPPKPLPRWSRSRSWRASAQCSRRTRSAKTWYGGYGAVACGSRTLRHADVRTHRANVMRTSAACAAWLDRLTAGPAHALPVHPPPIPPPLVRCGPSWPGWRRRSPAGRTRTCRPW